MKNIAFISLALAVLSALVIVIDVFRRPQKMWIMNLVWPITALYAGVVGLLVYVIIGRRAAHDSASKPQIQSQAHQQKLTELQKENQKRNPFWQSVIIGTLHCGAGCSLGDLTAEWTLFFFPLFLLGKKIFAAWVIDYVLAFLFGIAFQYFTIKPMKGLSPKAGLIAALKADALSLTAWQVGMYGWMAIVTFVIFGHELEKTDPLFWLMMQIAMLAGFLTSYPVNWFLIESGIKERM
jgi:hypothetical protein